jgi:SAM-dependent methyltransferase
MPDDPLALDAYEALADGYHESVATKPFNAYLERPATTSLLPDISGLRVLDAGCGPGVTTADLRDSGAEVVGLDVSPRMLGHAATRVGAGALVRVTMDRPLPFKDDTFDLVHAALSLDYVRDWDAVFGEFARVLDGGTLVFSVGHPFADHARLGGDYFATEKRVETWDSFGVEVDVPFYKRPLSALFDPLLEAGFRVERVAEAEPTAAFREADPETAARIAGEPTFLSIRARID